MKYVYTDEENINRTVPDNVRSRMIAGGIFGLVSTYFLIGSFLTDTIKNSLLSLLAAVVLAGIAFLFFFFAIRTKQVILSAKTRTPSDVIFLDEKHPFYSSECKNCHTLIDYQKNDLAYRLWFIKGYVECPCCGKPIRHNKDKNKFIPHRYPNY